MDINFDFINQNINLDDNDKYAKMFLKYCDEYDIDPSWLHSKFIDVKSNRIFIINGLLKTRFVAFVVKYDDGQMNTLLSFKEIKNFKLINSYC